MKGMVFYPPGEIEIGTIPVGLNPEHRRGIWIRESEVDWILSGADAVSGFLLDKPFWLSGVPFSEGLPDLVRAIRQHFEVRRHPLLVSLKDEVGEECERVFVVPDEWPARD